jgi:hypothetical protein
MIIIIIIIIIISPSGSSSTINTITNVIIITTILNLRRHLCPRCVSAASAAVFHFGYVECDARERVTASDGKRLIFLDAQRAGQEEHHGQPMRALAGPGRQRHVFRQL